MSAAELIRANSPDPMPYSAGNTRASHPFIVTTGSVTGTALCPPTGRMETAVYRPRWYTDDDYADRLLIEHRRAVGEVS